MCLWLVPCIKLVDLLPDSNISQTELQDYWTLTYDLNFSVNPSLLPKWAKAYHNKYQKNEEPVSSESDDDNQSTREEHAQTDAEHSSTDDSNEEDLDADPTARRATNAFYQNPEDQLHSRNVEETVIDPMLQYPQLTEMSNPRGENFMRWAEGKVLPTFSDIISRIQALRKTPALPDQIPSVSLNHKQRILKDIVHDYCTKWSLATNEGA